MQQETLVLKNFPWGAAITPYRRDHEDTPAPTKTLPIWAQGSRGLWCHRISLGRPPRMIPQMGRV